MKIIKHVLKVWAFGMPIADIIDLLSKIAYPIKDSAFYCTAISVGCFLFYGCHLIVKKWFDE